MTHKDKNIPERRTLRTECAGLHVRESADGASPSRTIAGYAVVFGMQSAPLWSDDECEAREVIAPEAITPELLDRCDIKFTMFHDRQLLLARSNQGEGTLRYSVDAHGVAFEFDAPHTSDGDKALELVRRGDISGCSFAFTTRYYDRDFVALDACTLADGRRQYVYTVRVILDVRDFTLTADPAYPDTGVEAREFIDTLRGGIVPAPAAPDAAELRRQIERTRSAAEKPII